MNKKSKKKIRNCLIILIFVFMVYFILSDSQANNGSKTLVETTEKQDEVTSQTISETLTASGEVKSANEEKLTLETSYYYLTMCAETDEIVKMGDNLLKYTNGKTLVAPYDCVITSYSVPKAKSKCTSSNFVAIASVDKLYMDINIGEEQIDKISVGQEVEIIANYDETKIYNGTITKINAIGEKSNGGTNYAAIASLDNDGFLKLGMSANCTITITKNENLTCLPIEAVQIENNKKFVNLIKDDEIQKVEVETGLADANYVQIVSGLNLGDKVSYEQQTVTVLEDNEYSINQKNVFSSIFNFGGNRPSRPSRGGF